jgi:predicted alpha/beta hydrolase family esterase
MAAELPHVRHLPTTGRDHYDLGERTAGLQREIEAASGPVVLVAHSAGVLTTLHWANRHGLGVQGALLATPPVLAQPLPAEYPSLAQLAAAGWLPIPGDRLPFPSIVAASRNDSLGAFENVAGLADAWGSHLVDLGHVGHLNPASGFGDWRWAEPLLEALLIMAAADGAAQATG